MRLAGKTAIVTGGGLKSIFASAEKRRYWYPPMAPPSAASRPIARR